jgi:hypothetical protein
LHKGFFELHLFDRRKVVFDYWLAPVRLGNIEEEQFNVRDCIQYGDSLKKRKVSLPALIFKLPGDAPWPGPLYRRLDDDEVNEAMLAFSNAKKEDARAFISAQFRDGAYVTTPKKMKKAGWTQKRDESISLDMVRDFANLHRRKDVFRDNVLTFARAWGPLWQCSAHSSCIYSPESITSRRKIGIIPHPIRKAGPSVGLLEDESFTPCSWSGKESLEFWRYESAFVYSILKEIKRLIKKARADEWNVLNTVINRLNRSPFGQSILLRLQGDSQERRPHLVSYAGIGFIRAIHLQFALMAAGAVHGQQVFFCSACGDVFFRDGRGVQTGQDVYCKKDECQRLRGSRATTKARMKQRPS